MRRRTLAIAGILPFLMACRDGPTMVTTPPQLTETPVQVVMPTASLAAFDDLVGDPFVIDLMIAAGARQLVVGFDHAAASAARGDVLSASRTLADTRLAIPEAIGLNTGQRDHEALLLRDVLDLVLTDAETFLTREIQEHGVTDHDMH